VSTKRKEKAQLALRDLFEERGFVRTADLEKRRRETAVKYKKGYEVRLTADSEDELSRIRRLLETAGFKPGKPFRKHSRWIQPVYGRSVVEWFLDEELP